jgi:hypothetical protein
MLGVLALSLVRHRGGGVPVTARGVPLLFGGPWLRPDTRYGPALDSVQATAVQAAALDALLPLAREHAGEADQVGVYCVGILASYLITPVSAAALTTLRARHRHVVNADRCRFRVQTMEVDRPGIWPRRAWLLWATVPEEPAAGQAVLDIGYHAGFNHGAVWRCFLSRRDGTWLVDSTAARWQS